LTAQMHFGLAFMLSFAASVAGETLYSAAPVGSLGGSFSVGLGISGLGQVVGDSRTANGFIHAFLYSNGVIADSGTLPGGTRSTAVAVNDSGQVTGYSSTSGPAVNHAFVYSNGILTDLGVLRGGNFSFANSINDSGQVTGKANIDGVDHAFLYARGSMIPIIGAESDGTGINALGQITGQVATASGFFHAFIYSNGVITELGTLGGLSSFGAAINSHGQVTGYSALFKGPDHAFLYSRGRMIDLGTLGGAVSRGEGLNDSGEVVGASLIHDGPQHAFLYNNGAMIDLNSAIVNSLDGFTLMDAPGINDHGQIVATGLDVNGREQALLLTPVPEPSSVAMIGVGLWILLIVKRWRKYQTYFSISGGREL